VTIPSQIRYVGYYADLLNKHLTYQPRTVFLKKITLNTIPRFSSNGTCGQLLFFFFCFTLSELYSDFHDDIDSAAPMFVISKADTKIYGSKVFENVTKDQKTIELPFSSILPLCGDIKIEFYHKEKFKKVLIILLF